MSIAVLQSGGPTTINNTYVNALKVTNSSDGAISVSMDADTYYEFTGNLTSLTLSLSNPTGTNADIWSARFYVRDTIPTLTLSGPASYYIWSAVSPDTLSTYTYYNLTVLGNIASLVPAPNKLPLSKTINGSGTVTLSPTEVSQTSGTVSSYYLIGGTSYTVTATASSNYTLTSLTLNEESISTGSSFMATKPTYLVATFTGDETTLTYNTPSDASIAVKKGGSSGTDITSGVSGNVRFGDNIYISITAGSGYTASYTVTGLTQVSSSIYTVTGANPTIVFTVSSST